MQIIDFHTHIYPEQIAEKATKSVCDFYNLKTDLIGTDTVLLSRGRIAGITNYVLLPVAVRPEQVRHINQFIVNEVEAHSELYGFGTLHAAMEDFDSEIRFIESAGLKGIKLHPDTQQFPVDDERLFPLYEQLQGKMPILIHCGDKRYDYSHPKRLRHIIDLFPKLRVIAAHLGGWSVFDEAFELLKDTDCYFDISSCMSVLSPEQMKKYINGYGADRVLFGSDFPLWDPIREVETFMKLDLTEAAREKIAFQNARMILGI
ncbi:MAG: amidohydrolase family protein [Acutalibacteraceae bacterium]